MLIYILLFNVNVFEIVIEPWIIDLNPDLRLGIKIRSYFQRRKEWNPVIAVFSRYRGCLKGGIESSVRQTSRRNEMRRCLFYAPDLLTQQPNSGKIIKNDSFNVI